MGFRVHRSRPEQCTNWQRDWRPGSSEFSEPVVDEIEADTDYKYHFAGLVLGNLDSPVLVWMRDHWLASSLFSAVVEEVPEVVEDTGCSYRAVVQERDNLDLQLKLSY